MSDKGILSSLFSDDFTGDEPEVENDALAAEVEAQIEDEAAPADETEAEEPKSEVKSAKPADEPEDRKAEGRLLALMDEREKRKDAEKQARDLQSKIEELQKQANPQQNPYQDDPYFDKFQQDQHAYIQEQLFRSRLEDSTERATEKHGLEAVESAGHWASAQFQVNPTLKAGFLASRRPAEYLVEQHQRETEVSAFMSDRDAYIRQEAAKLGLVAPDVIAQPETEMSPAQNKQAPKAPPKSLASVTGQGRATDVSRDKSTGVIGSLFGPKS